MISIKSIKDSKNTCELYPDNETEETMGENPEILKRSELLKVTGECIRWLKRKAISGRFADQDLEKLRDSKMRLLLDACKTHAVIIKDEQLDTVEARLKALEEMNTHDKS